MYKNQTSTYNTIRLNIMSAIAPPLKNPATLMLSAITEVMKKWIFIMLKMQRGLGDYSKFYKRKTA